MALQRKERGHSSVKDVLVIIYSAQNVEWLHVAACCLLCRDIAVDFCKMFEPFNPARGTSMLTNTTLLSAREGVDELARNFAKVDRKGIDR